jgi:hypothetical protein
VAQGSAGRKRVAVEARDAVDVEKECRGGSGAAVSVGARITRVWPLNTSAYAGKESDPPITNFCIANVLSDMLTYGARRESR